MEQKLKKLILKYKQELEEIKNSLNYNEISKIQTVSVLSFVIMDLEIVLNKKRGEKWKRKYFYHYI